jgi:flagellum-specific ATP synthase
MKNIISKEDMAVAQAIRSSVAVYRDAEDLISIGAYRAGSNHSIDHAISMNEPTNEFLRQDFREGVTIAEGFAKMREIVGEEA